MSTSVLKKNSMIFGGCGLILVVSLGVYFYFHESDLEKKNFDGSNAEEPKKQESTFLDGESINENKASLTTDTMHLNTKVDAPVEISPNQMGSQNQFKEEALRNTKIIGFSGSKTQVSTMRNGIQVDQKSPNISQSSNVNTAETENNVALTPKEVVSPNQLKKELFNNVVDSNLPNGILSSKDPQVNINSSTSKLEALKDERSTLANPHMKKMVEDFDAVLQNISDKSLVEMYRKVFNGLEGVPMIDKKFGSVCEQVSSALRTFLEELVRQVLTQEPLDLHALAILKEAPFQFYKKSEELNGKNPYALYYECVTFEELVGRLVGQMITANFDYETQEDTEKMLQQAFINYKKKQGFVEQMEPIIKDIKLLVSNEYSNVMYLYMFMPVVEEILRHSISKEDVTGLIQKVQGWMSKYAIHPKLPYQGINLQFAAPLNEIKNNFEKIYLPNPSLVIKPYNFSAQTAQTSPRSVNNASGLCYAISLYQCFATFYPLIKAHAIGSHQESKRFLNLLEELNKPGMPLNFSSHANLPSVGYPYIALSRLINGFIQDQSASDDLNWHHLVGVTINGKFPNLIDFKLYDFVLEPYKVTLEDCVLKGPILIVDGEYNKKAIPKELEFEDMTGESRKYELWAMVMGGNGHFSAVVRRADAWYHCDDAHIARINDPPLDPSQWIAFGGSCFFCFYLLK